MCCSGLAVWGSIQMNRGVRRLVGQGRVWSVCANEAEVVGVWAEDLLLDRCIEHCR